VNGLRHAEFQPDHMVPQCVTILSQTRERLERLSSIRVPTTDSGGAPRPGPRSRHRQRLLPREAHPQEPDQCVLESHSLLHAPVLATGHCWFVGRYCGWPAQTLDTPSWSRLPGEDQQ
jgi:hypothetical protein